MPGYDIKLIGEDGEPVAQGEMGELYVRGPTAAIMYWNNREKSRTTFQGEWTRSGDKYIEDADGYYICCGRADDMLKVSGMYVSPFEVEAALSSHPDVLEAAVVGWNDEQKLDQATRLRRAQISRTRPATRSPARCRSTSSISSRRTNIRAGSNSAASCRKRRPARSRGSS